MIELLKWYALVSIFCVITIFYGFSQQEAFSFTVGTILCFTNILVMFWAWRLIFRKKFVALAASVIVIKYAILCLIIYIFVQEYEAQGVWLAGGFVSFAAAVVFYALTKRRPL